MIIAIDIDGILTNEIEGHDYKNRTPNLLNIKKINKYFGEGHKIILFTSRYSIDKKITIEWLQKFNVLYNKIIFNKIKYDLFIDDKALPDFPN